MKNLYNILLFLIRIRKGDKSIRSCVLSAYKFYFISSKIYVYSNCLNGAQK